MTWTRSLIAISRVVRSVVLLAIVIVCCACDRDDRREVVVYTAHDRTLSSPILDRFEQETGIRVRAVYDAEAAKTTGLVNRLIARRDHPDADVFWNNEIIQTIRLQDLGLLSPYDSPAAARFDESWRDPDRCWTAFAGRLRLVIVNTELIDTPSPLGLRALADERWRGRAALAVPLFGTTLTHMAVVRHEIGDDAFIDLLHGIRDNDVKLAPGNGPVRDLVSLGAVHWGLTDTDDAYAAMLEEAPVDVALPDGRVILIPNTVSVINGAPNRAEAETLVDFLLSPGVERELAESRAAQIPLGAGVQAQSPFSTLLSGPPIAHDFRGAASGLQRTIDLIEAAGLHR